MSKKQIYSISLAAYPSVRIFFLISIGIILQANLNIGQPILFSLFFVLILCWGFTEILAKKRTSILFVRIATTLYLLIIIYFSASLYSLNTYFQKTEHQSSLISLFSWDTVTVHGTVLKTGRSGRGRDIYDLGVEQTVLPDGTIWDMSFKMRVYGSGSAQEFLKEGMKAGIEVTVYSFPERRNPHEFDYKEWLFKKGFSAHGELVKVLNTSKQSISVWIPIRQYAHKNIEQLFDNEHLPLAKAIFLGFKEELTPETKTAFSRAGLSHIMAVSGLHVGFIIAPFWLLIPYLWRFTWGKWAGLIFLSVLLLFYAGLTGFSPSVSRASLMGFMLTYGKLFNKVRTSVNLMGFAGTLLLIIDPMQLFDVGFQLSFAAVFVILLLMPHSQRLIPDKFKHKKIGSLISIILISLIVQIGLFPILTYYFGEFSIIGPLANALVVPILSITIPTGLALTFIHSMTPYASAIAVLPINMLLDWINWVAVSFGELQESYISYGHQSVAIFFFWGFAIASIAAIRLKEIRWKFIIVTLLSANLFLAEIYFKDDIQSDLHVTYLDVGQGDAVHIKTPNNKHILFDAGRWAPHRNSGSDVLLPYFEHNQIEKLDAVIVSHPHADHIGGLREIVSTMEIDAIYQSNYEYDSILYKTYMKLAESKGIPVNNVFAGDIIKIDDSIRLFVLGPEIKSTSPSNPNNHSVAIKLIYGKTSFLFTGDAEIEQETDLVASFSDFLQSDVLKVGHHGSRTSSTNHFLKYADPTWTIASLAFKNSFGHPNQEAVTRLSQFSDHQLYTSLHGAVKLVSDGNKVKRKEWD